MASNTMSESEFWNAIETLLTNPDTRRDTLARLNEACPGNPVIELANAHETNARFRHWLNNFCQQAG